MISGGQRKLFQFYLLFLLFRQLKFVRSLQIRPRKRVTSTVGGTGVVTNMSGASSGQPLVNVPRTEYG
jgi:hypothetical protein